ncbi:procollagen-lysine2-oxoglutarate 5-dioxygenase/glycosyltransferase 25 family member [Holotrichia oblita]|uniref:Procollagen-lysine2-oxoglutarate 5-dioxygenase/glycosyltransferase 25 family member n=1 Tax=Holotrichia oblita TaxID=644536 RepID=A0ACB9TYN9_HOLOL|nr:procollagen-lysine2-oxoglutarate 5-dioxygenase/glycosyltransferase 25 family member [Holotrichia oblita]
MFYTDKTLCVFLFFALIPGHICSARIKYPTVLISILARNKAHTLPYFLSSLERLNYPKERIALRYVDRIRSDHNIDNTVEILEKWIISVQHQYHSINSEYVDSDSYSDEQGPNDWSMLRFENVISLRESALNYAKTAWADYLLTLDCDVFLTNKNVLHYLIAKNLTVVAPMLKSSGLYSNFWFGMTDDYYYLRTGDYKSVVNREKLGCFETKMVHTCVLIDLRKIESDHLTYVPENVEGYDGPRDDIITFAVAANKSDIALTVCNEEVFGFLMIPLEQDDTIAFDMLQLTNVKLEVLNEQDKLYVRDDLLEYTVLPEKDTLDFDKIFMINLLRRPERRKRMLDCFDELGLDVTILDAVDGK